MRNWTRALVVGFLVAWAGVAHAQVPRELTVIVYGGSFEEGWKKAVIAPFEAANPGIKIRIATGLTMEAVAMMRAQKSDPKIDVVMMDEVGAAQANAEGLYEPLTTDTISNMAKTYPQFRIAGDPYTKFMYVAQVLAYDKGHIKTPPTSFKDLWNPAYKGFLALPDIDTTHGTMMLMTAARINGGSEHDIGPGFDALKALKPNIVTFWKQHAQVSQMFTQGDIWITSWTSDRAEGLIEAGGNVGWVIPKEGAYIIDSTIGIAKGSKQVDAARLYINYVLSDAAQAANARYTKIAPVNRDVRLPDDVASKLPAGEETLKKLLSADWNYITTQRTMWVDRWNREITAP